MQLSLIAVPNVTAHPSTTNVPITVLVRCSSSKGLTYYSLCS